MNTPYRLVSLADMMKLPIGKLVGSTAHISVFAERMNYWSIERPNANVTFPSPAYIELLANVEELRSACEEIGFGATIGAVAAFQAALKGHQQADGSAEIPAEEVSLFSLHGSGVGVCLYHESASKVALTIPAEMIRFYEPQTPLFGVLVGANFPSALYEIDEAAKCLALGRSTAVVFHLMRTMEMGIEATRLCLGISDPVKPAERNWGAILRKFKAEMDARDAANNWQPTDRAFFGSSYVSLDAVKNAWRNTTMHVEKKYTPDEAEHIFSAVKGFMQVVAARMDERGLPTA